MSSKTLLRLGTRGSPLALAQAHEVRGRLARAHPELAAEGAVDIVVIKTSGDRIQDRTLAEIGGKGLFTKEIEDALLQAKIDVAVHSMKDVPTWLPEGLAITAILPREDPRDAFFSNRGARLADLPASAVVGTASLRRQAQVLMARPDLKVVPLRGNVGTRLKKLAEGQADATLLAMAGLKRLGEISRISAPLEPEEMLPAVAQGAIGLEARVSDERTGQWLAALDHQDTAARVSAERACLEVLDGSCRTPIAALAELDGTALWLRALIAMPDGSQAHRAERRGPVKDAESLGRDAGAELRGVAGPAFFAALDSH
jgi:hydroxymethylbilane synthase